MLNRGRSWEITNLQGGGLRLEPCSYFPRLDSITLEAKIEADENTKYFLGLFLFKDLSSKFNLSFFFEPKDIFLANESAIIRYD